MANLRVDKITSTETFETTGSVQFDGSGDYLEVDGNGTISAGTGNFTIEGWLYKNAADNGYFFDCRPATGAAAGNPGIYITDTTLKFFVVDTSSHIETEIELNKWVHIALTKESGVYKLWIDGSLKGIHTNSTSVDLVTTTSPILGTRSTLDDTFTLNGFISNFRIVNGKALYTSNFKPPMRELEVIPGTVVLACQSKTDAALEKTGKTISANGNAVASELTPGLLTPIVKSGGGSAITGSVEFNLNGDGLVLPKSSDFAFGTGDFTIEGWFNVSDTGAIRTIFDSRNTDNNSTGIFIGINTDDNFYTYGFPSSTGVTNYGIPKHGEWHHFAVVRNGSSGLVFLNGIKISGSINTGSTNYTDQGATIGQPATSFAATLYRFKGFLSNIRVNKGTALYTDNFIPPTRELKRVPGTVLLCCQDPDNPLTEATGKTITGYGDLDQVYNTQLVTNGTFDSDASGWTASNSTLSVSSGQLTITNDGASNGRATSTAFNTVVGARYILKYDTITSGGSYQVEIRESNGLGAEQAWASSTDGASEVRYFQATHSQHTVVIYSIGADGVATKYDNFYVSKVNPGKTGSKFTPQVGDDRKVTFEGVTKINSNAYFYLPTGDTVTRESRYGRGLIVGGSNSNAIEYINITTLGNAQDYGDLTAETSYVGALASSTRGVYSRSRTPSSPSGDNTLEYSTLATTSNSLDFGDRTVAVYEVGALSNNTRGIIGGGYGPANSDVMDYVTIASTGNALDFGNLTQARRGLNGLASPTRGCFAAGYQQPDTTTETNIIDYVTIASTGNANDFGDLIGAVWGPASLASPTRGIWAGGITPDVTDVINYVTISSTGNAQDFGDLSVAKGRNVGMSNSSRGVIGLEGLNTMDYITIASTGNAQDFGDMMRTVSGVRGGCSDSHGGLG